MPITPTTIANRACQMVGSELIAAGALLTEDSQSATQIRACYDTLRRFELRRNVWRFSIRVTGLRPIDTNSKLITFGTYAAGTSYGINDIIVGDDGQIYFSRIAANIGNTPSTSPTSWQLYFGPDMATEFVTTWGSGFTYAVGDSTVGSDGATYTSIVANNTNHNPVGDGGVHWGPPAIDALTGIATVATNTTFYSGELVHIGSTVYLSLQNSNGDGNTVSGDGLPPPSSSWLALTTQPTISLLNFIYPIGSGPASSPVTKNVYRLPVGYLRMAPQDPKAGGGLFLGAPDGSTFEDWNFQDNYFVSNDVGALAFRFAADVQDTTQFDPMFAEGLAATIGIEVCEPLTQSAAKIVTCERRYARVMTDARTVNGIENGPVYPPEDSYITCRI